MFLGVHEVDLQRDKHHKDQTEEQGERVSCSQRLGVVFRSGSPERNHRWFPLHRWTKAVLSRGGKTWRSFEIFGFFLFC